MVEHATLAQGRESRDEGRGHRLRLGRVLRAMESGVSPIPRQPPQSKALARDSSGLSDI